ncbi:transcription initiation factor IID, 31kD subunit-domain-containing protein [Microdochium trichocladiopsis]|uniref:Transcription initiation factor IID, 31kD subunit-domain-containing protein n=1 Tax=Microdochium trichocladiopsis TaxID=1682393 RepID=A0A9P9BL79_9PEZI|nr:transcription initiation factor IID, 31kD subunit-domain-containing protein [Microdochium trichocladiopsis]KAH7027802.1 transcription initiation factor IID, 31kD subunit-domain-containing protein [Microdochium trichocladiopsis]
MATTASQTNGVPASSGSAPSQSQNATQNTTASAGSTTVPNTQTSTSAGAGAAPTSTLSGQAGAGQAANPSAQAPRPRDARTIELLLNSQGVTSFDSRVPLLLLDFAYRHTSSILNDALHLSGDPYISHAGSKPSASHGAAPSAPAAGDAAVSTNAINVAIASRQAYQFRGGSGAGGSAGGAASKEWLAELAKERNKVQLQRIPANEWGIRLPHERFVLTGMGWQLRDKWEEAAAEDDEDDDSSDEDDEDAAKGGDAMEGVEAGKADGAKADEGGLGDMLGDELEGDEDEDMEGME